MVGPNGAGKTTIFKLLTGEATPIQAAATPCTRRSIPNAVTLHTRGKSRSVIRCDLVASLKAHCRGHLLPLPCPGPANMTRVTSIGRTDLVDDRTVYESIADGQDEAGMPDPHPRLGAVDLHPRSNAPVLGRWTWATATSSQHGPTVRSSTLEALPLSKAQPPKLALVYSGRRPAREGDSAPLRG